MKNTVRRASYFYATVKDQPGQAYQALNQLAELGINLLALTVVPIGPNTTQMTIFPSDEEDLQDIARETGMPVDGPHHAILVQGNDEIGALADIHKILFEAGINVYASNGVSDGKGSYGYLLYVRPEAFEEAAKALGI